MLARDREHFIHLAAQTEKVNRNECADCLSIFVDQFSLNSMTTLSKVRLQRLCRNVVSVGVDVDENRSRSDARNTSAGRKKRVCRGNHGVAKSDFERHQDSQERVCSG